MQLVWVAVLLVATAATLGPEAPSSVAGWDFHGLRNAVSTPRFAQAESGLAKGRFLVASRQIGGPAFGQSVVLLLGYGPEGAAGLIINRPMNVALAELLPEVEELRDRVERAHFGGPVEPNRMMVLIQSSLQPEDSEPLVGDIYASTSLDTLRAAARTNDSSLRFRAYVGYAGWAPGQLDAEVARGDWYIDAADAAAVFEQDPEEIWPELIDRNSGLQVRRGTVPPSHTTAPQGISRTRPKA